MASQSTTSNNKRTLEERAGLEQLVKGMNDTGINRAPAAAVQFSTKDFMKRNLYGYGTDNVHSIFAAGLERRRREAVCLGYGDKAGNAVDPSSSSSSEPQAKRRRFQRRNSKTPAMLFQSLNFLPQDLFSDDKTETTAPTTEKITSSKPQDDDADWDGGLEIAEQLVKHLQKRRTSDASSVTAH